MHKLRHFLTWFTPILSIAVFEAAFRRPVNIYWMFPVLLLFIFFAVLYLSGAGFKKNFWIFLISPILLAISELLFIVFLQGDWLRRFIIIAIAIVLAVFLENIYIHQFNPEKYQKFSLASISNYLNLIIVFLFNAGLFLLIVFFNFSILAALIINIASTLLLVVQIFSVSRLNAIESRFFMFGIILVIAELFWAASYLPLSAYNQSLIITLAYYLMIGFSRNKLLGILNKKVISRYAAITLVCLLVILISAKQN